MNVVTQSPYVVVRASSEGAEEKKNSDNNMTKLLTFVQAVEGLPLDIEDIFGTLRRRCNGLTVCNEGERALESEDTRLGWATRTVRVCERESVSEPGFRLPWPRASAQPKENKRQQTARAPSRGINILM